MLSVSISNLLHATESYGPLQPALVKKSFEWLCYIIAKDASNREKTGPNLKVKKLCYRDFLGNKLHILV